MKRAEQTASTSSAIRYPGISWPDVPPRDQNRDLMFAGPSESPNAPNPWASQGAASTPAPSGSAPGGGSSGSAFGPASSGSHYVMSNNNSGKSKKSGKKAGPRKIPADVSRYLDIESSVSGGKKKVLKKTMRSASVIGSEVDAAAEKEYREAQKNARQRPPATPTPALRSNRQGSMMIEDEDVAMDNMQGSTPPNPSLLFPPPAMPPQPLQPKIFVYETDSSSSKAPSNPLSSGEKMIALALAHGRRRAETQQTKSSDDDGDDDVVSSHSSEKEEAVGQFDSDGWDYTRSPGGAMLPVNSQEDLDSETVLEDEDVSSLIAAIAGHEVWGELDGPSPEQAGNLRNFMLNMLQAPNHIMKSILDGEMENWWTRVPYQGMNNGYCYRQLEIALTIWQYG